MEKYGVIYRVHNKVTDNNYIGKTTRNFKKRYGSLEGFIREKKNTFAIQEDYNEYGIDSFEVFEEIDCVYKTNDEEYDKDLLSITEAYYIDEYMAYDEYNTRSCDYPLSISLNSIVNHWQSYCNGLWYELLAYSISILHGEYTCLQMKHRFEYEDYYNFLFTDNHLNHFNDLTSTKKKDNYSKYLIRKYNNEISTKVVNRIDYSFSSKYLKHFKGNILYVYKYRNVRWFNYDEFRQYHINLY